MFAKFWLIVFVLSFWYRLPNLLILSVNVWSFLSIIVSSGGVYWVCIISQGGQSIWGGLSPDGLSSWDAKVLSIGFLDC